MRGEKVEEPTEESEDEEEERIEKKKNKISVAEKLAMLVEDTGPGDLALPKDESTVLPVVYCAHEG